MNNVMIKCATAMTMLASFASYAADPILASQVNSSAYACKDSFENRLRIAFYSNISGERPEVKVVGETLNVALFKDIEIAPALPHQQFDGPGGPYVVDVPAVYRSELTLRFNSIKVPVASAEYRWSYSTVYDAAGRASEVKTEMPTDFYFDDSGVDYSAAIQNPDTGRNINVDLDIADYARCLKSIPEKLAQVSNKKGSRVKR